MILKLRCPRAVLTKWEPHWHHTPTFTISGLFWTEIRKVLINRVLSQECPAQLDQIQGLRWQYQKNVENLSNQIFRTICIYILERTTNVLTGQFFVFWNICVWGRWAHWEAGEDCDISTEIVSLLSRTGGAGYLLYKLQPIQQQS